MAASTASASSSRNDGQQLAFVGDVKRIEPENFARAFDFFADRNRRFIEEHADLRASARFRSARWSRRRASDRAGREYRCSAARIASTSPCNGAVSLAISVSNSKPFAHRHDRDAVHRDWAADDDLVAGPCARAGWMFTPFGTTPMPEVLMKILSPLPRSTTFVSPVTSFTPAVIGRGTHRLHDAPEILHRQTFLQNETGREIKRARAAHGEIVNGAMNGQLADVAAREKNRADDKRIGAEGQRVSPFNEKIAPSCSGSSSSLRNCGRTIFSISWWLSFPPLPCARTISL